MDSDNQPADSGELRQRRLVYFSTGSLAGVAQPVHSAESTAPADSLAGAAQPVHPAESTAAADSSVRPIGTAAASIMVESTTAMTTIPVASNATAITFRLVLPDSIAHTALCEERQQVSQGTQTSPVRNNCSSLLFLESPPAISRSPSASTSSPQAGNPWTFSNEEVLSTFQGIQSNTVPSVTRLQDVPSTSGPAGTSRSRPRDVPSTSGPGTSHSRPRDVPSTSAFRSRPRDMPSTSAFRSRPRDMPPTSASSSRPGDELSFSASSFRRTSTPLLGLSSSSENEDGQDLVIDLSSFDDKENQPPSLQMSSGHRSRMGTNWRSGLLSSTSCQRGSVDEQPNKVRKTCRMQSARARSESDEDDPVKEHLKRPARPDNWRESCIKPESLPAKRGRGRPKGSKNKPKQSSKKSSPKEEKENPWKCKICKDSDDDSAHCTTDCGHLFHVQCMERWIISSNQKYKTYKVCPYCGSKFQKTLPFFG